MALTALPGPVLKEPADPISSLDDYLAESAEVRFGISAELKRLAAIEDRLHEEFARRAQEARQRRDAYQRTLASLNTTDLVGLPKEEPKPKPKRGWVLSEEKIAQVRARFIEIYEARGVEITASIVAGETPGLSPETVKRALEVLREREEVRKVKITRGGGTAYAPMPNGDHAA